ncbi:hypothetical protein [Paramicrobacterium agarici]|uniref:Uncharacterized protein n=1 Tax=Paramicrobacterium agarici TaxID=630514 RepID=A0A2A9DVL6_9MICO|nr:hypothetical protein [Microbacterium agarici]PFG30728.1 hypothetical protein ATJ78_1664 [Microbacterium agarici]TQO23731.1 hypothetical protein FB385_2590 [Microbacterium agarici]
MLSASMTITAGVVLLTIIGIAYGGTFMLRVVTGKQGANGLQKSFFRAGHAHAGMLVTLGLVIGLLMSAADVGAWGDRVAGGVLATAILIPGGFFFSVIGRDPKKPNAWITLIWLGAALLTASLLAGGILLITTGTATA